MNISFWWLTLLGLPEFEAFSTPVASVIVSVSALVFPVVAELPNDQLMVDPKPRKPVLTL
jgi:hypothetical protein